MAADEMPPIIAPERGTLEHRRLAEQGLGWQGDEIAPSQCTLCRHRIYDPMPRFPACAVFLGGVPDEFLGNEVDHRRPVDYDGGVHFEPADDADPGTLARLNAYFDAVAAGRSA